MVLRRTMRVMAAAGGGILLLSAARLWQNRPRGGPGAAPLSGTFAAPASADAAGDVRLQPDILFGTGGGEELRLDLATPASGDGPFPLIVCIHGGAWCAGGRGDYRGTTRTLARSGYAAASVEYRLAPKHRFPAQIEDVKCAVRYLRAHARELRIDPQRVGALGDSAGGHLALLLGLMDPCDGMEGTGGCSEQASKVQAVVEYFGPADFTRWRITPLAEPFIARSLGKDSRRIVQGFLGAADARDPVLGKASPVTYVSRGDPPVLTFHGTMDVLVPIQQSRLLHQALARAGVPGTLVPVQAAMHGWGGSQKAETDRRAIAFFDRWLKGGRRARTGARRAGD